MPGCLSESPLTLYHPKSLKNPSPKKWLIFKKNAPGPQKGSNVGLWRQNRAGRFGPQSKPILRFRQIGTILWRRVPKMFLGDKSATFENTRLLPLLISRTHTISHTRKRNSGLGVVWLIVWGPKGPMSLRVPENLTGMASCSESP